MELAELAEESSFTPASALEARSGIDGVAGLAVNGRT
jgi:hypothetical protein